MRFRDAPILIPFGIVFSVRLCHCRIDRCTDEMNQCRGARNMPHCGRHVRACYLSCVAGKAYLALKNMPEWIGRRDRSALRFERCTLQVKGGRQNGRRKWEPAALHGAPRMGDLYRVKVPKAGCGHQASSQRQGCPSRGGI